MMSPPDQVATDMHARPTPHASSGSFAGPVPAGQSSVVERVSMRHFAADLSTPIRDGGRAITRRELLLVEIRCADGGIGRSFLTGVCAFGGAELGVIGTMIGALSEAIVGRSPDDIVGTHSRLVAGISRWGTRGAPIRAVSALELALWDHRGRRLSCPVHEMLGGAYRPVDAYCSAGYYAADPSAFVAEMRACRDRGFTGVKIKVGGAPLAEDVRRTETAREVLGGDIRLMVDANEAWDPASAIRFIDATRDCDLFWVEEPVSLGTPGALQKVAAQSRGRLATGENEYEIGAFRTMLTDGSVSVVQPDAIRIGGLHAWVRVANLSSAFGVPCVPHAVQEIHSSLAVVVDNCPMIEWFMPDHPNQELNSRLFPGHLSGMRFEAGRVWPPTAPGLGLELDEDAAAALEVHP
jgi:L-alanine-DL-glutamate epimerase-like enolase superfamily enzyme